MASSSKSLIALISISVLLTSLPSSSAAGRSTTPIANTILNGKGAPKNSLGRDGDFYIDTRSLLLYGPKKSGKWPSPVSLQGPTGPAGSDGKNGSNGKTTSSSSIQTGPQGPIGATGPQGPQGMQGERGEKGDQGLPGVAGPSGLAGSPGASGPSGPQGATGPTGATGPSEVTVVDIPSWTLSSGSTFSFASSILVGTLTPGSSYFFNIYITGTSSSSTLVTGADLLAASATVQFTYSKSENRYATYNSTAFRYVYVFSGTISNVQNQTAISIRIIDAYGETGANPLTLSGKAYITLVGAIK
jgi:hypothetical protein